mgnify:CR=1 FL=1
MSKKVSSKNASTSLFKEIFFVSHASIVLSPIIENEICVLKKNIECLSSTLSQCVFDHKRIESLFQRKQDPPIHAHTSRHAHTYHTQKYANMYHCSHCGRKGHLAKFYFDKLNILNNIFGFVMVLTPKCRLSKND